MENNEFEKVSFCTFNNIECNDMFELFDNMGEYWEEGKQFLYSGEILQYFEDEFSNENMIILSAIEEMLLGSCDPDQLFYDTLLKLNPNSKKIYWKGKVAEDYDEFIGFFEKIIDEQDGKCIIKVKKLLDDSFLSLYTKRIITDQHIYDTLVFLEQQSRMIVENNEFIKICKYLYFMLYDKASIVIEKVTFNTVEELANHLMKLEQGSFDVFEKFCKLIVSPKGIISEEIYYWLVSKGYFEKIEEWKNR